MTTNRLIWVLWCWGWTAFWFITGWFTLFLGWLLIPPSLLAILLPVGKPKKTGGYVQNPPPFSG